MRKNRLLSFVLAMVMLFGVVSAFGVTAGAEDTLDTPYCWFSEEGDIESGITTGVFLKWKLVTNSDNAIRYNVRGYYSIDNTLAETLVFSEYVTIRESRYISDSSFGFPSSSHVHIRDGYCFVNALISSFFAEIYVNSNHSKNVKFWFTVEAVDDKNTDIRSEVYTSSSVTAEDLFYGRGTEEPILKGTPNPPSNLRQTHSDISLGGALQSIPADSLTISGRSRDLIHVILRNIRRKGPQ
jgi:hypothetical protein